MGEERSQPIKAHYNLYRAAERCTFCSVFCHITWAWIDLLTVCISSNFSLFTTVACKTFLFQLQKSYTRTTFQMPLKINDTLKWIRRKTEYW